MNRTASRVKRAGSKGDLVQVVTVQGVGVVRIGLERDYQEYWVQAWDVRGDLVVDYPALDKEDAIGTAVRVQEDLPKIVPTPEQLAAVAAFALRHGLAWKEALASAWWNGSDCREPDGHLLRQVRNRYGPAWLESVEVGSLLARAVASGLLDKEA